MLSQPATPPALRCTIFPRDDENVATPNKPWNKTNIPAAAASFQPPSPRQSLGRRSVEAMRSLRGSIRGRLALEATTNNSQRAASAVGLRVPSGPGSPPPPSTKQRWYSSLRSSRRPSQIPTPTSPSSLSLTSRRPRLFRSPESSGGGCPPKDLTMPSLDGEEPIQPFKSPLPKLDLASFQSEWQASALFSPPASGKDACDNTHNKCGGSIPAKLITTLPTMSSETNPPKQVSIAEPEADDEPDPSWRTKCVLLYKGTAWLPEEQSVFRDASEALSYFVVNNQAKNLIGQPRWNNVVLWTGDIPYTRPKTKQTLTAYRFQDGPHRMEIDDKNCLDWAFIAFIDKKNAKKLSPIRSKHLSKEDERLMTAVATIRATRFHHLDVWTCHDSESWDSAMEMVRDFKMKKYVADQFRTPEYMELRKKYEAFIRYGVAGFSRDDITLLDKIGNADDANEAGTSSEEDYDYANDGYEHDSDDFEFVFAPKSQLQPRDEPLQGFLEHRVEVEDEDTEEDKPNNKAEIRADEEDLDMAARLSGASIV